MEFIHERCAGLDVHKETVVGCLRVREHSQVRREVNRRQKTVDSARRVVEAGRFATRRTRLLLAIVRPHVELTLLPPTD